MLPNPDLFLLIAVFLAACLLAIVILIPILEGLSVFSGIVNWFQRIKLARWIFAICFFSYLLRGFLDKRGILVFDTSWAGFLTNAYFCIIGFVIFFIGVSSMKSTSLLILRPLFRTTQPGHIPILRKKWFFIFQIFLLLFCFVFGLSLFKIGSDAILDFQLDYVRELKTRF